MCPRIQELNEIRERIGADYRDVGICLLNDDDGAKLDAIMDDERKAKNKLDVIFRRWIKGEGKKCTWEVLRQCLEHAELITLAEKVESACSMARDAANEMRSETTTNNQARERTGTTRSPYIEPNKQATQRQTDKQLPTPSVAEPNKQATQRQAGEQLSTPSHIETNKQDTQRPTGELASVLQSSNLHFTLIIALIIIIITTVCFIFWSGESVSTYLFPWKTETGM